MAGVGPHLGSDVNLARWGRAVVVVVVVVAALDWVGWATGVEGLTRVYPDVAADGAVDCPVVVRAGGGDVDAERGAVTGVLLF